MDVELFPVHVDAAPGTVVRTTVRVANVSEAIDQYTAEVYGVDPSWVTTEPPLEHGLPLFPEEVGEMTVLIRLPEGFPAGVRRVTVRIQSANDPAEFHLLDLSFTVEARPRTVLAVEPSVVTGGSRATYSLVATNEGNIATELAPVVSDPEDLSRYRFDPDRPVLLPPGRREVVEVQVRAKRHWVGAPKPKLLTFDAPGAMAPVLATFVQKPRISRLLLSLAGLLAVAGIFGFVIHNVVQTVSKENRVPPAVVDNALRSGVAAGEQISRQAFVITGVLRASTGGEGGGDPLAGVQAELFRADNPTVAIRTAATSGEGVYSFSGLDEDVEYLVRFSGDGYPTLWFPGVEALTDAAPLTPVPESTAAPVAAGPGGARTAQGAAGGAEGISFPALPGTISGTVIAESPTGTTVTVVRPSVPEGGQALVAETEVSVDGSYSVTGIPTPGQYLVIFRRPGAAVDQLPITLAPGQQATLNLSLRDANGRVSGQVTSRGQPLGGVTVSATDGRRTIGTVSLTEGAAGSFELRGLSIPGSYTVTASAPDFTSETKTVTVGGEDAVPLNFDLLPAVGSISGQVAVAGFGPTGGVLVTVTSGDLEVTTTSLSQGAPGSFRVEALPAPGTYTVSFTRPDLETQTVQVVLDPARGVVDATNVSVALTPAAAGVQGVIVNADGAPVAGAAIELSSGTDPRTTFSANDPPGGFGFSNLPPGAYVLSASLPGSSPAVQLVNVRPGDVARVEVRLERQAALVGIALKADGTPLGGATIRLYPADRFPGPASAAVATTTTGPDGRYPFVAIPAPAAYGVAGFQAATEDVPFAIQVATSQPSTEVPVPPLVVPPVPVVPAVP
jgi:hypothetical protein